MAAEFTGTTPGINYDPRHNSVGSFFKQLQAALDQQPKKNQTGAKSARSTKPKKPADFHNPTPLPDPGPPATGDFRNPNLKVPKGMVSL